MSQVGYMFLGVGAGTLSGAMFHLYTHAFFKSLLFLGAGCIVLLAGENNIFAWTQLPGAIPGFRYILMGALALAGAPLTSGFFSKDGILTTVFSRGSGLYELAWALGSLTAFVTALYTFRLIYLVFGGGKKTTGKTTRVPFSMAAVLPFLAIVALSGGVINLPAMFWWP